MQDTEEGQLSVKEVQADESDYEATARRIERDDAAAAVAFPIISDAALVRAQKSVENLVKAQQISLRATNKNDWANMNGKPYLLESGVMKVARVWGLSFRNMTVKRVNETVDGTQIIRFIAQVTATSEGREIQGDGIASSDDDFFSLRKDSSGEPYNLPLGEVDLNSVRKKALTNAQSRAIKKLLGLGGLTWEDVNAATTGRGGAMAPSVDYGASKAKKQDRTGTANGTAKVRLRNMLADLAAWDRADPNELLKGYSSFSGKDGKTVSAPGIDAMSDTWAEKTLKKVEAAWSAHPGNGGPGDAYEGQDHGVGGQ